MDSVYYSGAWGAILGAFFISFAIGIAFYVVSCIFLDKIFAKAGVEGGWRAKVRTIWLAPSVLKEISASGSPPSTKASPSSPAFSGLCSTTNGITR